MLWEAHWLVVQYTINTKNYCTIYNIDTVAYATHSGSYSKRKYTTHWYTTITAVHNIHSGAQHIHDTETFALPEGQVALTMISVYISVLGVVVRGAKKHYVNVKTKQTLNTLRPRN